MCKKLYRNGVNQIVILSPVLKTVTKILGGRYERQDEKMLRFYNYFAIKIDYRHKDAIFINKQNRIFSAAA